MTPQLVKNASEFQEVHASKWNEMISATALRNIREAKWNVPTLMPFTEDVQKMHTFLSQMQEEWFNMLSESPSTKAWTELAKVCLAQMILFNQRREGEVASMPLTVFLSRDTSDPHEDVDWALSEVEKKLCRHFTRVITRGKRGRPVPILLTPKMLCSLELLVKQREACGVLKDNTYMFARPEAMTHFRGSDCLRGFAKVCGAKCPKALTSTRLRKHAATLSTVLNMTDTEMDQLANFLGHDIRIHQKVIDCGEEEKGTDCEEDGTIQEGHCSSTVEEPSAEMALPSAERNTSPPPKRSKPSKQMPSGASAMRLPCKGKTTQKRTPWQQTEVLAVERHLKRCIISGTVPAKSDCEKCLRAEPEALRNRDWKTAKFYAYNRITAYKKKLQCR
ncbi:hypothetical protein QQF64_018428 [Cirrhinus molitorella]|uniref:Uncharacterized protein n=1 Tax=Cirrhinus molitorella TaxID=172907 RepID=A0ABR3LG19_9TELE